MSPCRLWLPGGGGSDIETPTLDKLAKGGARLEQFYAQPMCTPSRAALMTGRYPHRYGLQTLVIPSASTYGLSTDEWLLPQALKEAGYRTAIVGKWHLGHADRKYWPASGGSTTSTDRCSERSTTSRTRSARFTGEVDMSKSTIPADNGPFRDGKGSLYEGGTRVVALASWPGHVKAGSVVDQPIHVVDMYPTLAGLAGASLARTKPLDGVNLRRRHGEARCRHLARPRPLDQAWPRPRQGGGRPLPRPVVEVGTCSSRGAGSSTTGWPNRGSGWPSTARRRIQSGRPRRKSR